jgi:hypothetical protein
MVGGWVDEREREREGKSTTLFCSVFFVFSHFCNQFLVPQLSLVLFLFLFLSLLQSVCAINQFGLFVYYCSR